MDTIREKIAYLKGIMDADPKLGEDRVKFLFQKMLALFDEISGELDSIAAVQAELEEYIEEIDLDLAQMEDEFYDEDDEDDDHHCGCGHHHHHDHGHDDDDDMVQMDCPECGERVQFEEEFLYDDDVRITCPNCGGTVFDSEELGDDDFDEFDELEDDEQ